MSILAVLSQVLLLLFGLFLMIVVLLQRGRGGGLAGAFGGAGGQSAFGTKAGDVFTRITIVVAVIWVVLAGGSGLLMRASSDSYSKTFAEETDVDAEAEEESAEGLELGEEAAIDELLRSTAPGGTATPDQATPAEDGEAATSEGTEEATDATTTDEPAAADSDDASAGDAATPSDDPQQ